MVHHYFTLALRNIGRQKAYSFINIGGLSVGMAVAMLIGLDEFLLALLISCIGLFGEPHSWLINESKRWESAKY